MKKHTPTPWNHAEDASGHQAIYDKNGNQIVRFGEGLDEHWREPKNAKANAAFIVQCVNSREAIVEGLYELRDRLTMDQDSAGNAEINKAEIEICDDLIAKAEGR